MVLNIHGRNAWQVFQAWLQMHYELTTQFETRKWHHLMLVSVGLLVSSKLIIFFYILRPQFRSLEKRRHGVFPKTQFCLRMGEQRCWSYDLVFQVQWQQLHFCMGHHDSSWKSAGLRYLLSKRVGYIYFYCTIFSDTHCAPRSDQVSMRVQWPTPGRAHHVCFQRIPISCHCWQ